MFYKSHDLIQNGGWGEGVVFCCVAWLFTMWGLLGKDSPTWSVSSDGSAYLHDLKFDYRSGITELQGGAFTGGISFSFLK